ncbi:DUF124 domain-containing protein [Vibrio fluvialis PG41]|uniref:DUF124 domain-containing protein n=1 Tax=Vibrio fluvialis PG41 TaxID=1336752 RepID=S7JGM9_VIBFL|nr:AIM24 family protein [Vibrio fluvialis]EPP21395.1 DUF124 domain-containing protein [Vibrio fluvialis PG41]
MNKKVCHEIEIETFGEVMSHCKVTLDPGEVVIAEAGALMAHDEGIEYKTVMGDGSEPKTGIFRSLFNGAARMLSGETLFMTHFKNVSDKRRDVYFSATVPGSMAVIDMGAFNGSLICNKNSFLCGALGTKIGLKSDISIRGLFGESFFLQRIEGDGNVCLNAGGGVFMRQLNNETIFVDNSSLLAYVEDDIEYEVVQNGSLKSMLFSGEGLSLVKLSGTGVVLLQTMPFDRFAMSTWSEIRKNGGGVSSS